VPAAVSGPDKARTREAGFDGQVDKPYDDSKITKAIRAALKSRRTA